MTAAVTPGRRLEEVRHAVARIIDPNCWWDDVPPNDHQQRKCNRALTKADEIITRLAAKPADEGQYLVWSNQHRAWWRPNSHGYTDDVKRAGRYSRAEAISISFQGRDGWDSPKGVPDELAIAERDVPVFTASTTVAPKLDPPDNSLTDPSTMGEVE